MISMPEALEAQDSIFYDDRMPKAHVEALVFFLRDKSLDTSVWKWPYLVKPCIDLAINHLESKFGKSYEFGHVEEVIQFLFQRHHVFQTIMESDGVVYKYEDDTFQADDTKWAELIKVIKVQIYLTAFSLSFLF